MYCQNIYLHIPFKFVLTSFAVQLIDARYNSSLRTIKARKADDGICETVCNRFISKDHIHVLLQEWDATTFVFITAKYTGKRPQSISDCL